MNQNPLQMIVQMAKAGKDPRKLVEQMAASNPQARAAMQIMQGKSSAQLEQIARNMAKESGFDIEGFARSWGMMIPSNK